MRSFILPFFLFPTTSLAETFVLSTHENWSVSFVESKEGYAAYCTAVVYLPTVSLSLDVREDEGLRLWLVQQNAPWADTPEATIYLWSDIDPEPWHLLSVFFRDTASAYIGGDPNLAAFLKELSQASILYIDYNVRGGNGPAPDVIFSISGAKEAIIALASCSRKLIPTY